VNAQGKDSLVDEVASSTLSSAITNLIDSYKQAQKLLASDLGVVRRTGTNTSMDLTIKKFVFPKNLLYSYIHCTKSYQLSKLLWFNNFFLNSGGITRSFLRRRIKRIISNISSVCYLYLHYEDNSTDNASIQTILNEMSKAKDTLMIETTAKQYEMMSTVLSIISIFVRF
jgi:hypothetical protein